MTARLLYEQTDIPEGMTIREWRANTRPRKRKRRRSLARILAGILHGGWRW